MPSHMIAAGALIASVLMTVNRAPGDDKERSITVSAGKLDRLNTVVSFQFPNAPAEGQWTLQDDVGSLPVQFVAAGDAHVGLFILPELKAGQSRTWRLAAHLPPEAAGPQLAHVENDPSSRGTLKLIVGGKELLRYQGEKSALPEGFPPQFQRGGYISSVLTPAGKLVTDDYPPNHKHHHAIWSPWTKTEFEGRHPDFWNMGEKTGTVEFVEPGGNFSGPVAAGFTSKHRFIDLSAAPQPKPVLGEQWLVEAYNIGTQPGAKQYFLFDWQSTQTCVTSSPLTLLKYHYGGLGIRGNRHWDGADHLTFFTSEGKDRKTANETRARWSYLGGAVDGQPAGIAILCAPDDFRFPQPVRIHPTEPFFCHAPEQLGEFKIEPGKPYVARYRFVVLDGELDQAMKDLIERLWKDYAEPPTVEAK